jgi:hypothetical protein
LESFPAASEEPAGPRLGDVVLLRWGRVLTGQAYEVPKCDQWAMGRIEQVTDTTVVMRVTMFTVIINGKRHRKVSSAGCVKGCTLARHNADGLAGGALVYIRREGMTWSRKVDPEAFRWVVWDDAIEVVQAMPRKASAA